MMVDYEAERASQSQGQGQARTFKGEPQLAQFYHLGPTPYSFHNPPKQRQYRRESMFETEASFIFKPHHQTLLS